MSEGQVLFETVLAGDWLRERFPSVLESVNRLLFRECWEEAKSIVEYWPEALATCIAQKSFGESFPLDEPIAVTAAATQAFQRAVLNRYALAEAHPFWPGMMLERRVALANRLAFVTALRFITIKTRLYRARPVPLDSPYEFRTPDGKVHVLRVDLCSPVPGYDTPR